MPKASPRKPGFDTPKFLEAQSRAVMERFEKAGDKLYLEVGGKLLQDYHAARVLPGFDPDTKLSFLLNMRDRLEVLFAVNARDVQRGRVRGDFGLTYDLATLRTLDDLRQRGLPVSAVVITRFEGQPKAIELRDRLERRDMRVFLHGNVAGYPHDVDKVASEEGFGRNTWISTTQPVVVVSGAGPGSGKIETALQQMWHDQRAGVASGFAKWETFPVWDLAPDHPLNLAYEAATADLQDRNLIDPFHIEAYGEVATNYNRDIDHFPVLRALLDRLGSRAPDALQYRSPTDMCVNRVTDGIIDMDRVVDASELEIARRFFRYRWEHAMGMERPQTVEVARNLLKKSGVEVERLPTVEPARAAARKARTDPRKGAGGACCGAAVGLPDGSVVSGANSPRLYSTTAAVLNAVKHMAGIPQGRHVLSPEAVDRLVRLKRDVLGSRGESLDIGKALQALAVSAAQDPAARACFATLPALRQCELHMTHLPAESDQAALRQLGVLFTTDAEPTPGNPRWY